MIGRVRDSLFLFLAGFAMTGMLVACGGDDNGPTDNGNGDNGTVDFSVISGEVAAPFLAGLERLRLGAPARPGAAAAAQPEPDSVFAGTPRQNGNISFEGPGEDMTSTDSYQLNEVPAGRRRLIVAVLGAERVGGEKPHIGRVLVYARTTPGGDITTEPMNHETTLEGAIHMGVMIGEHTTPGGLINNPQLGLVHRFSEETAETAATTRSELQGLVTAYRDAQRTFIRSIQEQDIDYSDSLDVNADVRDVAQAYAEARAGGTDIQTAHEDYIDGAVAVYADRLGGARPASLVWGVFGTVHDSRLVDGEVLEQTRLESARNLLNISVNASQQLVENTSAADAAKTAVSDALSQIRTDGMAAGTMDELIAAVNSGRADGVAALEAALGRDVDETAADLGAFLDTSQDPPALGSSIPDYISQVESAEGDAGVQDLLIALMGGPGY